MKQNKNKDRLDLGGLKFGRLTALRFAFIRNGASYWLSNCECGNEKVTSLTNLMNGHTKSCGCFRKEELKKLKTKHGFSGKGDRTYKTWLAMNDRCNNSKCKSYKNYGGRGIVVCNEWSTFEKFLQDMGERPKELTLDRINNNGNYEKTNCRWSTRKEQGNNKRNNRILVINNNTKTLAQWSEESKIGVNTIRRRIASGWTIIDSITKPVRFGNY